MKTKHISQIIIAILVVGFLTALCDARTRVINTSSGRDSKAAVTTPTEEQTETKPATITNRVSSSGSEKRFEPRGNIRDSGNIRSIKTGGGHSGENGDTTFTKTKTGPVKDIVKHTDRFETSDKMRVYKTTENPAIRSTETKKTVSIDTEVRNTARAYKAPKEILEDKPVTTIANHSKGRDFSKEPISDEKKRDYRHYSDKIGNVREGGNVYTKRDHDWYPQGKIKPIHTAPDKIAPITVRHSKHFIHDADRHECPREFPNRYYYSWGGHWYRFPVARNHYPRYFYYWRDDAWCRVDRRIVFTTWVYNDYYDYNHAFVSNTVYAPEVTYPETIEYGYDGFIAKGETEENLIVKTMTLTQEEAERVELLLDADIIQNILASVAPDEENREENSYEYQTEEGLLIVTAPEELVLKIQTIVQDEATFDAFNNGSGELAVDVISVVSPVFLEKDYNEAVRLGGMNSEEISKFLASLDRNYRYSDKKCWYNESIGTITVVDDEENLYRAWDYMNKFPYIPKEMTY